jgi:hypothetical protein
LAEGIHFRSARELRKILDEVMEDIASDPDDGPRMRSAAGPMRLEFTDLKLVFNISQTDDGRLRWNFRKRGEAKPKLAFSMDSDFGNRLLQGRENPAIAIARGRLHTDVVDAGAALRFFPATKPLFSRYRALIAEKYPHLALDQD